VPAGQNTTTRVVLPGTNNAVAGNCGPGGTIFVVDARGFHAGETVSTYVSLPDQSVIELDRFDADAEGKVTISLASGRNVPAGITGFTMEGLDSHIKAIAYFKIVAPAATPTQPPSSGTATPIPCDTSGSRNGEARPNSAKPGDTILFTARGFQPGEDVSYWFTLPDGSVGGTTEPQSGLVNPNGTIGPLPLTIDDFFAQYPGTWGLTFQGQTSQNTAVIFFCVNP